MPHDALEVLDRPPEGRGHALLALPEDQWFERKSARIGARELADALIGLANAEGGIVVVGLHRVRVEGVADVPQRVNEWRQAPVDFAVPAVPARFREVECIDSKGNANRLLVAEVDPSDRVHANRKDEVYLRIGDETRRLTFDQRRELEFDKGQSNFETTPARHVGHEQLSQALLTQFAERVGHPDPDRLLQARGLIRSDGAVSIGAVLLFADAPQAELPEAHIRVLRFRGRTRGTGRRQQLASDDRFEGPLPRQIEAARERIAELIPTRRALAPDGTFTNVGAVPRDAWLEGLVNAVIHRSYSVIGDHVRVAIFDDRVEIESPGRFPGIVDLSDPQSVIRFARNPRIARVLADLHFGQELGEGIRRMFEEMRLAGLAEPRYRQTSGSVQLTLSADPVDQALEARLSPTARSLVRAIRELDRVSTGDLVQVTGRSRPVVLRDLRALEEAGVVEWIGTSKKDPRAYWRLRVE